MSHLFKNLSRRERQIMDIIYARGSVSALEIQEAMPDPPSYSTVRTLLRILETKGHIQHQRRGMSYIFSPTQPHQQAAHSALTQVVQTFFGSSIERAVTTLLSSADTQLTDEELDRLSALIEQARATEKQASDQKEQEESE